MESRPKKKFNLQKKDTKSTIIDLTDVKEDSNDKKSLKRKRIDSESESKKKKKTSHTNGIYFLKKYIYLILENKGFYIMTINEDGNKLAHEVNMNYKYVDIMIRALSTKNLLNENDEKDEDDSDDSRSKGDEEKEMEIYLYDLLMYLKTK